MYILVPNAYPGGDPLLDGAYTFYRNKIAEDKFGGLIVRLSGGGRGARGGLKVESAEVVLNGGDADGIRLAVVGHGQIVKEEIGGVSVTYGDTSALSEASTRAAAKNIANLVRVLGAVLGVGVVDAQVAVCYGGMVPPAGRRSRNIATALADELDRSVRGYEGKWNLHTLWGVGEVPWWVPFIGNVDVEVPTEREAVRRREAMERAQEEQRAINALRDAPYRRALQVFGTGR